MVKDEQDGALLDDVFLSLGWWGRYQRVQFITGIGQCLPCAIHIMSIVFIGREVGHRCADVSNFKTSTRDGMIWDNFDVMTNSTNNNVNVTYNQCSIDVMNGTETIYSTDCIAGYRYEDHKDSSIVSQWDLVCERESLSDVSQTVMTAGMLLGASLFPNLSDAYGRKPVFMFANFFLLVLAVANVFSPDYISFVVMRFFLGAFQQGTDLVVTVLLIELLPTERRALPPQVGCFMWAASLLIMCLIAYLTRELSWQVSQLIFAACSIYALFQWWVTEESVRWLVANNKISEAERIVQKAAKVNNVDQAKVIAVLRGKLREREMKSPLVTSQTKVSINDVVQSKDTKTLEAELPVPQAVEIKDEMRLMAFVKNRHVLFVTVISCYMWFSDSMSYYGLTMTSSSLTDDLYLGFFLSVLVELPAALAFALLINRLGRRTCMIWFHILGGLSLLTATILSNIPATGQFQ